MLPSKWAKKKNMETSSGSGNGSLLCLRHCCAHTEQQELIHMRTGIIEFSWFCQNQIREADTTINR
jgi:hypothetical protein